MHQFKVSSNAPKVTYRQAGDRYILVEYGDNLLDLNLAYRIHKLDAMVKEYKPKGIFELSAGVRSVLVEYTDEITQKEALDTLVSYEKEIIFVNKWKVSSRIIKLPMAFETRKHWMQSKDTKKPLEVRHHGYQTMLILLLTLMESQEQMLKICCILPDFWF